MARLNTRRTETPAPVFRDSTPADVAGGEGSTPSSTPGASFTSDKENRAQDRSKAAGKRPMADSSTPAPQSTAGRKRRLAEQGQAGASQRRRTGGQDEEEDKAFYDPEQDPEDRRKLRSGLRANARELQDRADDFNNNPKELGGLLERQNDLFRETKQTADATIDSRFLVSASELTLKRSKRVAYGDSSIGIDLDEFVAKCATFMKHGRPIGSDEPEPSSTQARRNRSRRADDDDDDNDGDAMNWHVLGELACFPNNKRPAVPSFLLGPLSVQKRVRATQRVARAKDAAAPVSKPQELKASDLERNETSNLTAQCQKIRERLQTVIDVGTAGLESDPDAADESMTEEQAASIFARHDLELGFEVSLFKFAINPRSFGQTVENLFYISFLVKDGYVSVNKDRHGLPTIRPTQPKATGDQQRAGAMKHQAIFSLDYGTYRNLIDAFEIEKSLIAHRQEESTQAPTAGGWYG